MGQVLGRSDAAPATKAGCGMEALLPDDVVALKLNKIFSLVLVSSEMRKNLIVEAI